MIESAFCFNSVRLKSQRAELVMGRQKGRVSVSCEVKAKLILGLLLVCGMTLPVPGLQRKSKDVVSVHQQHRETSFFDICPGPLLSKLAFNV